MAEPVGASDPVGDAARDDRAVRSYADRFPAAEPVFDVGDVVYLRAGDDVGRVVGILWRVALEWSEVTYEVRFGTSEPVELAGPEMEPHNATRIGLPGKERG